MGQVGITFQKDIFMPPYNITDPICPVLVRVGVLKLKKLRKCRG
jgi:hypothetical protein